MATAFSLDRFAKSEGVARVRQIEEGIPVAAVRELIRDSALTVADLSQIIAPRRTLDRRMKSDTPLSLDQSDRFSQFLRVFNLATRIFGSRAEAMDWLKAPKQRFDLRSPMEMMRTVEGGKAVETLLIQSEHGILA